MISRITDVSKSEQQGEQVRGGNARGLSRPSMYMACFYSLASWCCDRQGGALPLPASNTGSTLNGCAFCALQEPKTTSEISIKTHKRQQEQVEFSVPGGERRSAGIPLRPTAREEGNTPGSKSPSACNAP